MGVMRKMARAIVYASIELGGIYDTHTLVQSRTRRKHLKWGKEIATDIRILLSHAQLHSGLVEPVLEAPQYELAYLVDG